MQSYTGSYCCPSKQLKSTTAHKFNVINMQLTYMFVALLGVIIGGGSITLASNPSSRETKNGMYM